MAAVGAQRPDQQAEVDLRRRPLPHSALHSASKLRRRELLGTRVGGVPEHHERVADPFAVGADAERERARKRLAAMRERALRRSDAARARRPGRGGRARPARSRRWGPGRTRCARSRAARARRRRAGRARSGRRSSACPPAQARRSPTSRCTIATQRPTAGELLDRAQDRARGDPVRQVRDRPSSAPGQASAGRASSRRRCAASAFGERIERVAQGRLQARGRSRSRERGRRARRGARRGRRGHRRSRAPRPRCRAGGARDDAEDVRVDEEVLPEVAPRVHVELREASQARLRDDVLNHFRQPPPSTTGRRRASRRSW